MGKVININTHKDYKLKQEWAWLSEAKEILDKREKENLEFYNNEELWDKE